MNESIRVAGSKAPVLCAPYAFPSSAQEFLPAAFLAPADATATSGAAAAPRAYGAFAPALQAILVPYVPREFRPAAELAVAEPTDSFAAQAALFAAVDVPESSAALESAVELPWIDAFTDDSVSADESWPMDDAGRRLDELAQSLGSLDASRARATDDKNEQGSDSVTDEENGAGLPPDAPVAMWSEDEWIDILPLPEAAEATGSDHRDVADGSAELRSARVESAARALEGLAQRVRDGGVAVPAFPSDIADEAMLAGLLASMLGWPQ